MIQAIIDKTGNNWEGFPFLFALCTAASMVIWFAVDVTKGRKDASVWAEGQRKGSLTVYADPGVEIVETDKT